MHMIVKCVFSKCKGAARRVKNVFYSGHAGSGHSRSLVVYDDPLAALYHGGSLFEVDLRNCIHPQGFSYGRDGWHFLTAALLEYLKHENKDKTISAMTRFLEAIPLDNALAAMNAALEGPEQLRKMSPAGHRNLMPWSLSQPEDVPGKALRVREMEGLIRPGKTVQESIYDYDWKARNYVERLVKVYDSIRENGYQRKGNESTACVLRVNGNYRYCILGGQHRLAALSVLGYESAVARFKVPVIIDPDEIRHWPLVRSGLWNHREARQYFEHLADFDSLEWAMQRGLCLGS